MFRSRSACAFLLAAILLTACSTVSTRIQKRPEAFHALSAADRALVSHGKIREGLSKDDVFIAWGRADEIARGSVRGRAFETWIYFGYEQDPVFDYYNSPRFIGRRTIYQPSFTPNYIAHAYVFKKVTFESEKVVAWSMPEFR